MARYVIDSSVVLEFLSRDIEPSSRHQLLAPSLIRSEILESLYRSVRSGELEQSVALDRLARFSTMKIRFLGDKVLRRRAWSVAEELQWESTGSAEYVALTQLQADALVTLDQGFAAEIAGLVETAPFDALL